MVTVVYLKSLHLKIGIFLVINSYAQPANDNPCSAITMPVIESADPCTAQVYNISAATYLNLVVPNACGNTNPDVWYTFTPTRNLIYITISGSVQIQLYSATSCNGSFTQNSALNCFNGGQISFGIDPGTLYYMRISNTVNSANFSFSACITNKYPAANQRVGINTNSPSNNFDVRGRAFFSDSSEFLRFTKFYSGIEIANTLKLSLPFAASNKVLTSDATGNASWQSLNIPISPWTSSSNNIYNSNAGNVGIGETSPVAKLSIKTAGQEIMHLDGPTGVYFTLAENGTPRGYVGSFAGADQDIELGTQTQNTTGSVHLSTTNIPRLTVSPAGNIGIGNTSPTRPLSFPAFLGEKILLYPGGIGEVGIGVYGGELRLHCDIPGGKVSFGTQDNEGNFDQTALAQRNGVYAFSVLGSLWVNGTTYASDERFKQNITPIQSPLQKLLLLNGVEYEMRTTEFSKNHFQPGRQMGLLAQNVEKVVPEAVNEKDGYKGVDYARLIPLLIESIKELKKEIEVLKAK